MHVAKKSCFDWLSQLFTEVNFKTQLQIVEIWIDENIILLQIIFFEVVFFFIGSIFRVMSIFW